MDRIEANRDITNRNEPIQDRDSLVDKSTHRVFILADLDLPCVVFPVDLLIVNFLLHPLLDVLGQTLWTGSPIGIAVG
jgi:hypothetical protein